MDLYTLLYLYGQVKRIIESDISWRAKYDLIFSSEISERLSFQWADPNGDYKDDILAFKTGFDEYMKVEK